MIDQQVHYAELFWRKLYARTVDYHQRIYTMYANTFVCKFPIFAFRNKTLSLKSDNKNTAVSPQAVFLQTNAVV